MHKQRLGILIAASVGILTSFLPWITFPETGTLTPFQSNDWQNFILFTIPVIICISGKTLQPLNNWQFYGSIIPAVLAVLLGFYLIWFTQPFSPTLEFGIYLMIIAGIALVVVAIKTKDQNIQNDKRQNYNLTTSKLCPYCAEIIQKDAKKCKFCGEFLDDDMRREREI